MEAREIKRMTLGGKYELHRSAKMELPADMAPGDIYAEVHVRINTPIYRRYNHQPQWTSDDDRIAFDNAVVALLASIGMTVDGGGSYASSEDPMESLYCHPDDLSGTLSMNRLLELCMALENCETSSLRWVDIYAYPEKVSDSEIAARMESQEAELVEMIVRSASGYVGRKFYNLTFKPIFDRVPGLQFIEEYARGAGGSTKARELLQSLLDRMTKDGLLEMALESGQFTRRFYRPATLTDLKKIRKADRPKHYDLVMETVRGKRARGW